MIAVTLTEPTVAIVEGRTDLERSWQYFAYLNRMRFERHPELVPDADEPYAENAPGAPSAPVHAPVQGVQIDTDHLYLMPSGLARDERSQTGPAVGPWRLKSIFAREERLELAISNDSAASSMPQDVTRHPFKAPLMFPGDFIRDREMQAFGMFYPVPVLALLNPALLLRDFAPDRATRRESNHLGIPTVTQEFRHVGSHAGEEMMPHLRLGSFHVEAAVTVNDPPMLLEWSALHQGEPFSTTRVTWFQQGIELDPAIFTDPRIPAPPLPFDRR